MGILRPVVRPFAGAMLDTGHDFAFGCITRSKLFGYHYAQRIALPSQKRSALVIHIHRLRVMAQCKVVTGAAD
jgi:hypothetical protein